MNSFKAAAWIVFISAVIGLSTPVWAKSESPTALRVMSYNILVELKGSGPDSWGSRRESVVALVRAHSPDIIGFQEPTFKQAKELKDLLPEYASHAYLLNPENLIFYRKDRLTLESAKVRWHSPRPSSPFSVGFGNGIPRYFVMAHMIDQVTQQKFLFVNTHFDNTMPFQTRAAQPFVEQVIAEAEGAPILITGDFNSRPSSDAYQVLAGNLTDTYGTADERTVIESDEALPPFDPDGRIDHILFAQGNWHCSSWTVDRTAFGNPPKRPSDHSPIVADVMIR